MFFAQLLNQRLYCAAQFTLARCGALVAFIHGTAQSFDARCKQCNRLDLFASRSRAHRPLRRRRSHRSQRRLGGRFGQCGRSAWWLDGLCNVKAVAFGRFE
jgi:hypothetical protein